MEPSTPPDATIDEAVHAFWSGQVIFYVSKHGEPKNIWLLCAVSRGGFDFVCVTNPAACRNHARSNVAEAIHFALVHGHDLYLAPSLSTVLNAYDL